ncbi:hypothetical protein PXD04_06550 [Methanosphaera sp. ISO3-F5]|uniref:hypothetical protein n=1 Tax=Methanosphaera sp. ISO3-F5 TaxID=1452353 RepID=UPI002B25D0DA|nr:hypothetical protein [Methanosphaera sp. ISO3-F5]WQH63365.1 hypothetical protein PXD04_06550 [Methanosphaera sp. ISO3-F5]
MIDWDIKEIEKIEQHYKKTLNPSLNLTYFCRHFEEIYRLLTDEEELLPDILNDITYYTINGINAKYKVLISADTDKQQTEKLLARRMKQRAQRQEARNKGLTEYHKFIIKEVAEFIKKYPYWKELLRYK